METPKPITWLELRTFVNQIPVEHLDRKVSVFIDDETYARPIYEAAGMHEDIYCHISNDDDCGTLKDLEESHGVEFDPTQYKLSTKKGTPFLWSDSDIN